MKIKVRQNTFEKIVCVGRIKTIALIVCVADYYGGQDVYVYYKDGGFKAVENSKRMEYIGYPQVLYCVDAGVDYLKPFFDSVSNTLDISKLDAASDVREMYSEWLETRKREGESYD